MTTKLADVGLADKYEARDGNILISGTQALVRLPLIQRELDHARGMRTAGFISGYRGSPLGGYDSALWSVRKLLEKNDIHFAPAINEDLAATAVLGTQQIGFLPGRTVDGVFSIWYGKGPGVDRSGDALKHANLRGTERNGGILLVYGDDHAGKSSTTAHQSDLTLASFGIPTFYPANVEEVIRYGLAGLALSRLSGLAVGLKICNETAEATAVVSAALDGFEFLLPEGKLLATGVNIRKEFMAVLDEDVRLMRYKLPLARAFADANAVDRIAFGAAEPILLIVTAGKAFNDVIAALELLGIDAATAERLGIGVYKVALVYPLNDDGLRRAAVQAQELVFVEEKRAHLEVQAASALFNWQRRPRLSGKSDPDGVSLFPSDIPLDPSIIAPALLSRIEAVLPTVRDTPAIARATADLEARADRASVVPSALRRRPAFCAGCPHASSTAIPPGAAAMTGIGCHGMAMFLPDRNPLPVSHMGGEGAAWIGMAPFTEVEHIFQNLGDGTYSHSGSLAVRAAVQAGVNITYKILFNDAVAMTGGQPVEGALSVGRIARQMLAENVRAVVVVAEDPSRFAGSGEIPDGVELHPRDKLDEVQRRLQRVSGVSILIYDQVCAAEKRRRRKRGLFPQPAERAMINHLVCEGCGDCSVQSNCLAIQPRETELGRKRSIDQSACNVDLSCLKGFCPSFVTVSGMLRRTVGRQSPRIDLPEPVLPATARLDLLIAGVGGTGVVTIGAVLAMAAHLEGRGVSVFDMTGLSQKGGAVFSHVRLFETPGGAMPVRIGRGEAQLILACDAIAASQADALATIDRDRAIVVVNDDVAATADFARDTELELDPDGCKAALRDAAGREPHGFRATTAAQNAFGDAATANMILLGAAWQAGAIPLSHAAIDRAIVLNGVAVSANRAAFALGRELFLTRDETPPSVPEPADLAAFVAARTADLAAYWNSAYARRYAALAGKARGIDGDTAFAWAVARGAYKVMAYKDEYEVARLHSDGRFADELAATFEPGARLRFHLAPPMIARPDPRTGRPRKIAFGPAILPVFRFLARLKFLRETPVDIFGRSLERKSERRLRDAYFTLMDRLCDEHQGIGNRHLELAESVRSVRGFGVVRDARLADALALIETELTEPAPAVGAASKRA